MVVLHYVLHFLMGALFSNCIPHLASGLRGEPFPTPFGKPRGAGLSSPIVNAAWGSANLFVAIALCLSLPMTPPRLAAVLTAMAGFAVSSCFSAFHFGQVRSQAGGAPPTKTGDDSNTG